MALQEAVIGAIADLTSIAIQVIAKKLDYSGAEAKQIEANIVRLILLLFVSALCFVTFKYS